MLYSAAVLFVLALVAGLYGFTELEVASTGIPEFLFFNFVIALAILLVLYVTKRVGDRPQI